MSGEASPTDASPWAQARGAHPPRPRSPRGEMTTPSTAQAKDLMVLAERMGIPVDEAMRQVAQLIADVEPAGAGTAVADAETSVAVA
jgi:hypothetical protein